MAIINFRIHDSKQYGTKANNHHEYVSRQGKYSDELKATSHHDYIEREGDFSVGERYEDLVCSADKNFPSWSEDNPQEFWEASQQYERKNGKTYTEFLLSLPHEFTEEENIALVEKFTDEIFEDKFVYSYGIHSKESSNKDIKNIHVHIMFCERKLDGIERSKEKFFKRYNNKNPELGGAKKDPYWNSIFMPKLIRNKWTKSLNEELSKKGIELLSAETLKVQRNEALKMKDFLKAELLDREPINIDGNILLKLNKSGFDSLSKNQKEELKKYKSIIEKKELKEEIYKTQLKELEKNITKDNSKSNENSNEINQIESFIGTITSLVYYEFEKNKNEMKLYDKFEIKRDMISYVSLGKNLLLENELNKAKDKKKKLELQKKIDNVYSIKNNIDYSTFENKTRDNVQARINLFNSRIFELKKENKKYNKETLLFKMSEDYKIKIKEKIIKNQEMLIASRNILLNNIEKIILKNENIKDEVYNLKSEGVYFKLIDKNYNISEEIKKEKISLSELSILDFKNKKIIKNNIEKVEQELNKNNKTINSVKNMDINREMEEQKIKYKETFERNYEEYLKINDKININNVDRLY